MQAGSVRKGESPSPALLPLPRPALLTHLGEWQLRGQGDTFLGQQFLLILCQHQLLIVPVPGPQQVGGRQVMLLLWKPGHHIEGSEMHSLQGIKQA
jgi:hypothetical protein